MKVPFDFRPLVATVVLFLLLVGFFEAAVRWSIRPPVALPAAELATAADTGQAAQADTIIHAESLAPTPEPAPCPTTPIRFVRPDPTDLQPRELHRYVGSVGRASVTMLLMWPTPLGDISGSFYWHRGGPQYPLLLREGRHRVLVVANYANPTSDEPSQWELKGWPGAQLRGTWRDTAGRRHPVLLQESYAGGVRADVHTLRLQGGRTHRPLYASREECREGSYDYHYLQFPRPQAVPLALRRAIGSPAVVRRRVRALYDDAHNQRQEDTEFLLNDFHLLAYRMWRGSTMVLDEHGDFWPEFYLYDLTTGREMTLASQFRPDCEPALNRLLQHHLLHEPQFDFINRQHQATWLWQDSTGKVPELVSLPKVDLHDDDDGYPYLVLTGSGLELTLSSEGLYDDGLPGSHGHRVEIPYRELRPLVRPGTPLARMLQARGM